MSKQIRCLEVNDVADLVGQHTSASLKKLRPLVKHDLPGQAIYFVLNVKTGKAETVTKEECNGHLKLAEDDPRVTAHLENMARRIDAKLVARQRRKGSNRRLKVSR